MSTIIRPELSEKNKYWIERQRYYELKHFCLQYPQWKKAYMALDGYSRTVDKLSTPEKHKIPGNPTADCVEARAFYLDRMQLLERTATNTDEYLASYILKGVTEGVSYDYLNTRLNIPCSKDTYYDRYRKFFWLLDSLRK